MRAETYQSRLGQLKLCMLAWTGVSLWLTQPHLGGGNLSIRATKEAQRWCARVQTCSLLVAASLVRMQGLVNNAPPFTTAQGCGASSLSAASSAVSPSQSDDPRCGLQQPAAIHAKACRCRSANVGVLLHVGKVRAPGNHLWSPARRRKPTDDLPAAATVRRRYAYT